MAPDWVSTSAGITSIGTSDSACVRLLMRVPVTTTADRSVALAGFSPWDPASWAGVAWSLSASCAFAMPASANSTDAANKVGMFRPRRSEEHTSELQSLMRISYAVFCLKKKKNNKATHEIQQYVRE